MGVGLGASEDGFCFHCWWLHHPRADLHGRSSSVPMVHDDSDTDTAITNVDTTNANFSTTTDDSTDTTLT